MRGFDCVRLGRVQAALPRQPGGGGSGSGSGISSGGGNGGGGGGGLPLQRLTPEQMQAVQAQVQGQQVTRPPNTLAGLAPLTPA